MTKILTSEEREKRIKDIVEKGVNREIENNPYDWDGATKEEIAEYKEDKLNDIEHSIKVIEEYMGLELTNRVRSGYSDLCFGLKNEQCVISLKYEEIKTVHTVLYQQWYTKTWRK